MVCLYQFSQNPVFVLAYQLLLTVYFSCSLLAPIIKEYLEVGVKNDEHLTNYQELLEGDVPQVQRKAKDNTPKVDPALVEQQAKEEETKKTRTRKSTKKTSKKRSRKFGSFGS